MGVDEGDSMIISSIWLCLLMKIIRFVIKPSLISRYHPKTKCGVELNLSISQLGDSHLIKVRRGNFDLCTSFHRVNHLDIDWADPKPWPRNLFSVESLWCSDHILEGTLLPCWVWQHSIQCHSLLFNYLGIHY
jgi:hypothetical protein